MPKEKKISSKIQTILWATDFSKESRACLAYVKRFGEKLNTRNHALYILPKFSDWVYEAAFLKDDDLLKTIEKTKENSFKRIETVAKKAEIPLETGVIEGIASEELIRFAENNNVDMIFAGRRGTSEIEEILIGSTTSRLIRNSSIPVFVIPKTRREPKIDRILCPIDLSESSLPELGYGISLARQLDAKLYVVHVAEFFNYRVPVLKRDILIDKINEKIVKIAEENEYKIENIIYEIGEPAQKIIETAKKNKIQLILMATHQRKGFEKLFLGSISEKVLMYCDIPVLILPPSNYE